MKVKLGDYDISDLLTSYTRSVSTETIVGSVPVSSLSISFDNSDTQYNAAVILNSTYEVQPTDTSQSYFFKAYKAPESYSGIVELTLYDSMYEFTLLYSSSLEYPATIQNQLDEMIDLTGMYASNSDVVLIP